MRYSPLLPQAKSHGNRKVIRDFQRKYEKKKGRLGVWKFSSEVEAMDALWGELFPGVLVGEAWMNIHLIFILFFSIVIISDIS